MEDEEVSLGHALVGDHDEEIIMVALVKTTCLHAGGDHNESSHKRIFKKIMI